MDIRKERQVILKTFTSEEILQYAEKLDDEMLEGFVEALEKSNLELEENVNRKITVVKNKKTNLSCLLKRVWLNLKEEEKEKMAGFFEEINKIC